MPLEPDDRRQLSLSLTPSVETTPAMRNESVTGGAADRLWLLAGVHDQAALEIRQIWAFTRRTQTGL
jgi:hypothetical protein